MSTPSLPPEPAAPMSEISRLTNVFVEPGETFRDLPRASRWWSPWLVVSVFSLIFVVLLSQKIGFEQVSENQIALSSRADQFEKLPADQRQAALDRTVAITRVFSYGSPVLLLVMYLIVAGVLLGVFNAAMGAEIKFPTMLSIVTYSGLVHLIGTVLAIVIMEAGAHADRYNVANPSGTNPAYYLDAASTNKFVYGMLTALDAITIWSIVLMGVGVAAVSKVKRGTAIMTIVGLYLVWKLAASGLAAAF